MTHQILKKNLVIASHNQGKVSEINELFETYEINLIPVSNFKLKEPVENGISFRENALIKARAASKQTGYIAIGDDSGLCINALNGNPGIFSARWAGPKKDFELAINRVKTALKGKTDNAAQFICGLALVWPDGHEDYFEGNVEGIIKFPPKGKNGFGYDPIFYPNGYNKTFSEFSLIEKNKITHRTKAFLKLASKYL